ncbi:MAG: DUF5723 family protein [Bacteroidales bacterium]|jgi:hypothetical protein|nr:DUF5723 family protein [Bacteroidales bacterium]
MKLSQYKVLLAAVLLLASGAATAQINTVYFMRGVPERSAYNPAFQPQSKLFIDIPVMPNWRVDCGLPVRLSDAFVSKNINGEEKTVLFLHPAAEAERDKFYNKLTKTSRFYTDFNFDILSFGFRIAERGYFTFNFSERLDAGIYLPKDLFHIVLYGTGEHGNFDLKKLGIDASLYSEMGFGYSHIIDERLTVGGKFKILLGQANIKTDFDRFNLVAGVDEWAVNGKGTLSISAPITLPFKNDGNRETPDFGGMEYDDDFSFAGGSGIGIDLGATFRLLPNLQLSAALTDLGFIRWKNNITTMEVSDSYSFDGIDYIVGDDVDEIGSNLRDELGDVFTDALQRGDGKSYSSSLSTRLNIGGEYCLLNDKLGVGMLITTLFANKSAYADVTASANFRPLKWLAPTLNATLHNGKFPTIGIGVHSQLGFYSLFFAVDRIPLRYSKNFIPVGINGIAFQGGVSLAFGRD